MWRSYYAVHSPTNYLFEILNAKLIVISQQNKP